MDRQKLLMDFFGQYARVSLGPEPEKLAGMYDGSFLAAGPKGGAAFTNDETFLAWLRQVSDFNRESGMTGMRVDSVTEALISDDYTMVTVGWAATFRKTGDEAIRFAISYILHQSDGALKIAAYISHEDQADAMRARGLF